VKDMSPQGHFLTLFIILAFFSSCFGSYQEDPLDPIAYSTKSKLTVQDKKYFETESFGLTASTLSASPQLVNVDDFGAKGDGGDDTEVSYLDKLLVFWLFFVFFFFQ
jgi:hypothetical protein